MKKTIDVLGMGSAIVDIVCRADDVDLERMNVVKGSMRLIEKSELEKLESFARPVSLRSGGSVSNTIVQLASLGGLGAFVGKLADDDIGSQFIQDLNDAGVDFNTSVVKSEAGSGRCYIFVTPDAQRTMLAFLGGDVTLSSSDLDADAIQRASIVMIEGYLFDFVTAKELIQETANIAAKSDTEIAFTLSDPTLVGRHRAEMQKFVRDYVDFLFGNEIEMESLYETRGMQATIDRLKNQASHLVCTRGALGSVVVSNGRQHYRDADPVAKVVDTTGAGDAFAGGFLYGFKQRQAIPKCMDMASAAAAAVISHFGARVEQTPPSSHER